MFVRATLITYKHRENRDLQNKTQGQLFLFERCDTLSAKNVSLCDASARKSRPSLLQDTFLLPIRPPRLCLLIVCDSISSKYPWPSKSAKNRNLKKTSSIQRRLKGFSCSQKPVMMFQLLSVGGKRCSTSF